MKTTHDLGGELLALPNLPLEVAGWAPRAGESIAVVLSPDATAILLRAPDYLQAPARQCIVKGCENRSDVGTFVGSVCLPCHAMLTTGVIKRTRSFLGALASIKPDAPDTRALPTHRCRGCGAYCRVDLARDAEGYNDGWSICQPGDNPECCRDDLASGIAPLVPMTIDDMRTYILAPVTS